MGEDVPSDEGYRPLRYGRLALHLRGLGYRVVRISPSFSHFRREQRNPGQFESEEGTHVVVQTGGFEATIGVDRAKFIGQFMSGTRSYLRSASLDDSLVIVGVPPTGMIANVRATVGRDTPIIADVRDLWPDAMAVGRASWLEQPFRIIGRATSRELLLADEVVAVTEGMAAWAPKSTGATTIPIGLPQVKASDASPSDGLRACFLSNHTHGFDFDTVLASWQDFARQQSADVRLDFIGAEPQTPVARALVDEDESIGALGRILPEDLPNTLATYDLGLVPSLPEWSYSVGNKVFDYLASGLVVLHSMQDGVSDEFEANGLGSFVPLTQGDWTKAFEAAASAITSSRPERAERIERAEALYGIEAVCSRFEETISRCLG